MRVGARWREARGRGSENATDNISIGISINISIRIISMNTTSKYY